MYVCTEPCMKFGPHPLGIQVQGYTFEAKIDDWVVNPSVPKIGGANNVGYPSAQPAPLRSTKIFDGFLGACQVPSSKSNNSD